MVRDFTSQVQPQEGFLTEKRDMEVLVLGDLGQAFLISFSDPEIRENTMLCLALDSL